MLHPVVVIIFCFVLFAVLWLVFHPIVGLPIFFLGYLLIWWRHNRHERREHRELERSRQKQKERREWDIADAHIYTYRAYREEHRWDRDIGDAHVTDYYYEPHRLREERFQQLRNKMQAALSSTDEERKRRMKRFGNTSEESASEQ